MAEVSVVIPALNEAENIAAVVRELPWALIRECIVVDNGSTDATAAVAQAAGARVVVLSQRGFGRACAAGAAAAIGDILVFAGWGQQLTVIPEMHVRQPMLAGDCDFVIGSRRRGKRRTWEHVGLADFRPAGWRAFFSACCSGSQYTDAGTLPRDRRATLQSLSMREETYGWNLEMQMRAAQAGLRIREIPVSYRKRAGGESKVAGSFSGSLRAAIRIVQTLLRVASTSS